MNKTPQDETHNSASSATHQTVQKSSTLNRRYVKRPKRLLDTASEATIAAEQRKEQRAANLKRRQALAEEMNRKNLANLRKQRSQSASTAESPAAKKTTKKSSAKKASTAKQPAIEQPAPRDIPTPEPEMPATKVTLPAKTPKAQKSQKSPSIKSAGRARRFIIAFSCSAACVAALALLVHFNMPDLSVKVAALQTGIEAAYPSYIPRDYQLSGVSTDKDGRVVMEFAGPNNASFTLTEEKSTWDSTALLNNYVKKAYGEDYTTLREQGITLYIDNTEAVWVNGGMLYQLTTKGVVFTKKQIKNIATSL